MTKKKNQPLFEELTKEESELRFREVCEHRKKTGGHIPQPHPDPWTWDYEPHVVSFDLRILSSVQNSPTFSDQYEAVKRVRKLRERIESNSEGAGFDVLYCVMLCGTNNLVMPEWLSCAFNQRYYAVSKFRALSWDDELSFGKPYPKSTSLKATSKKMRLIPKVWLAVGAALEEGSKIDASLFESIGKNLNIGKTLADDYYYLAINQHGYPDLASQRDSQIAKLFGIVMAKQALGENELNLDGAGMLKIQSMPAIDSREFLKKSGITKPSKKGAMKSLPTSEHEHAPKPKQAASKPKRAPAKTSTSRSPRRAS